MAKTIKARVANLRDICNIQCSKGNYDQSEYMRGMANGLTLAVSIFDDKDPGYFDAPVKKKQWWEFWK